MSIYGSIKKAAKKVTSNSLVNRGAALVAPITALPALGNKKYRKDTTPIYAGYAAVGAGAVGAAALGATSAGIFAAGVSPAVVAGSSLARSGSSGSGSTGKASASPYSPGTPGDDNTSVYTEGGTPGAEFLSQLEKGDPQSWLMVGGAVLLVVSLVKFG